MSILFVADNLNIPSQLWMRRMLRGLGDSVKTIAVISNPGDHYRKQYNVVRTKEKKAPLHYRLFHRKYIKRYGKKRACAFRRLRHAINSKEISSILVHYMLFGWRYREIWKKTDKPVWIYCHNHDWHWNFLEGGKIDMPFNVRFIANSQKTATQLLKRGVDESRIVVQGLGVDIPEIQERNHKRLNILFLGRLVECKGPDLLIKAFDRASDLGLDATLTIAGYGPMAEKCALVTSSSPYKDRIRFVNPCDFAMGERLRQEADIFTAHNQRGTAIGEEETFGVSFLEAMAAGLPVVTGRSGALDEIIFHEKNGLLFEPGDVEAHAQALLRLQDDALRKQMGMQGREFVKENFSLEKTSEALRKILLDETICCRS